MGCVGGVVDYSPPAGLVGIVVGLYDICYRTYRDCCAWGSFPQRFKATQNKLAELQSRLDSYLLKDDTSLESVAENITDNNADKDFIDRVISLIEDNIGNTDFDIDFCAGKWR